MLSIGFLASVAARIIRRPPKLSYSMAKLALEEQFYSPEKARKELGMPATPIKEAVNHCLTWWEENAYLERK
jgi:dihydroflavonol-4-reductase